MFYNLITQPIFNLLMIFYSFVGDFGVAIVMFAVVVKLLMWPLTKSQYKQTLIMRKIQPKLKEIKRKAAGNKQLEMMMTMNLYKANGVKMSRSFLSMLIILPIFIVMFTVVRWIIQDSTAIATHSYSFVKNLNNVKEVVANPGTFKPMLFGTLDLSGRAFDLNGGWNSLILLMFVIAAAVMQYVLINQNSMHSPTKKKRRVRDILSEAADGKQADQSEINQIMMGKMNKVMPILLFFTFGNIFGALAFYSLINSGLTLFQNKLIRHRHADELNSEVKEPTIINRERNAKEAEIVAKTIRNKKATKKSKSDKVNITRIKAKRK